MKDNLYLVVTIYHQPKKGLRTEKSTIYDKLDVPSLVDAKASAEYVNTSVRKTPLGTRTRRNHPDDTSWTLNPHAWNDIEVPEMLTRVILKKMLSSAVVIDLKNDKLIRNRFEKNDPADILRHFKQKYLSDYLNKDGAVAAAEWTEPTEEMSATDAVNEALEQKI